jgi:glutathione S-transferase
MLRALLALLAVADAVQLRLHAKAGPDGQSFGDCPFAHAVRMVMEHKGVSYSLLNHGPEAKPAWLIENYGGSMPALEVGEVRNGCMPLGFDAEQVVTESGKIADYLEERYPSPSLRPPGFDKAEEARKSVFGSFARYCKHSVVMGDGEAEAVSEEAERKQALLRALCELDAHLESCAGPYAAGSQLSLTDCFLVPVLFHLKVAGAHFKGLEVPSQFGALRAYMDTMHDSAIFRRTAPPSAMVRWGWANARGDVAEVERAAAEICALP